MLTNSFSQNIWYKYLRHTDSKKNIFLMQFIFQMNVNFSFFLNFTWISQSYSFSIPKNFNTYGKVLKPLPLLFIIVLSKSPCY